MLHDIAPSEDRLFPVQFRNVASMDLVGAGMPARLIIPDLKFRCLFLFALWAFG